MQPLPGGVGMKLDPPESGLESGNEMGGHIIPRVCASFLPKLTMIVYVRPRLTKQGIWLSPPGPASNPFFTFIGSSNLSNRSLKYDTELSLLLMTSSPSLRKALGTEVRALNANAKDVSSETWKEESRRVSWLAWLLIKIGVEGYL
jgi:CDP-diacylglycerol--glycerol-3-phosphate 3-phosphatidyltransferase